MKLNLVTVHKSAEMAIEALGFDDANSVASFCSELSKYLTQKSFTRFSIRVSNLPSVLDLLAGLPLVEEGRLVSVRKTRKADAMS